MRKQPKHPFADRYKTEDACVARIESLRWPHGPVCYRCGQAGGNEVADKPRLYRCTNPECRTFFSVTAETPFAYSKRNLPRMFALLERIAVEDDKLVLLPLTRELGLCWSTLHKMSTRLRDALRDKDPIVLALRDEALKLNPEPLLVNEETQ